MTARRRDVRYALRCPVELRYGRNTSTLMSEDVSYRGVFLRTDTPPGLRQLVTVTLKLPAESAFAAHGMTVHVVPQTTLPVRTPGIGIQFYALDAKLRHAWDAFIRDVATRCPPAEDQALLTLVAEGPEHIRRRARRYGALLPLRCKTIDELLELYARDVSTGGMFIETDRVLAPGTEVVVHVSHPRAATAFSLAAVVRHRQTKAGAAGVGVELIELDDAQRQEFLDFVREGAPPDSGAVFIDEDDPRLL